MEINGNLVAEAIREACSTVKWLLSSLKSRLINLLGCFMGP